MKRYLVETSVRVFQEGKGWIWFWEWTSGSWFVWELRFIQNLEEDKIEERNYSDRRIMYQIKDFRWFLNVLRERETYQLPLRDRKVEVKSFTKCMKVQEVTEAPFKSVAPSKVDFPHLSYLWYKSLQSFKIFIRWWSLCTIS